MVNQNNVSVYKYNVLGIKYIIDLQNFLQETLARESLSMENRTKLEKIQARIDGLKEFFESGGFIGVLSTLNNQGIYFKNVQAEPLWETREFQYRTNANGDGYYYVSYIPMKDLGIKDKDGDQVYLLETGEEVVVKGHGGSPECFASLVVQPLQY